MSTTPPDGASPVPPEPLPHEPLQPGAAPQDAGGFTPPQAPVPPPPAAGYPPAQPGYQQGGYPPPTGYAPVPYAAEPVSPSDERTFALLAHLGTIVLGFIAPLIVFLIYKDRSAFLRHHAAEALNFQITVAIVAIGCAITVIGLLVVPFIGIGALVLAIIAGLAANKGEYYRYPLTLRLVK